LHCPTNTPIGSVSFRCERLLQTITGRSSAIKNPAQGEAL
jgi:hypothetical protein